MQRKANMKMKERTRCNGCRGDGKPVMGTAIVRLAMDSTNGEALAMCSVSVQMRGQ